MGKQSDFSQIEGQNFYLQKIQQEFEVSPLSCMNYRQLERLHSVFRLDIFARRFSAFIRARKGVKHWCQTLEHVKQNVSPFSGETFSLER